MLIRKQDIYTLELEHLADYPLEEFEQEIINLALHNYSSWLLPQLVAHFGRWKLYSNGRETVVKNTNSKLDKVFYQLTRIVRSALIKNQAQQPEYASLTPLILLGLKRGAGYSYEQFREYEGLEWLLEPRLYEALSGDIPQLGVDRLMQIRQQGLTFRTGPKTGQQREPSSTWKLYGVTDTELGQSHYLLQGMLCQIWLAHPKNRRNDMILDPNNWDHMPQPLIDSQPLWSAEPVDKKHKKSKFDKKPQEWMFPWEPEINN